MFIAGFLGGAGLVCAVTINVAATAKKLSANFLYMLKELRFNNFNYSTNIACIKNNAGTLKGDFEK